MFRYDQDRDRFVPDRHQDAYSFSSVHDSNALNHQCVYCNGSVTVSVVPPALCPAMPHRSDPGRYGRCATPISRVTTIADRDLHGPRPQYEYCWLLLGSS
jgi:hypothetical protein